MAELQAGMTEVEPEGMRSLQEPKGWRIEVQLLTHKSDAEPER